jgi:predicted Ser/Thr protein kinase
VTDVYRGEQTEFHHPISVALRFKRADAPKLKALADRLAALPHLGYQTKESAEAKLFAEAAEATKNGERLVFQCGLQDQLDEVLDEFPKHGISRPLVEVLRVFSPVSGGRSVRL